MANEEHLNIIRQGVAAWNDWREKTPLKPDLRQADLRPVTLDGVNLRGADLWMADLQNTKLCRADLRDAHLYWVDLRGADLSGADLNGADLNGADLEDAILIGANLSGAYLNGTYLNKANLFGANLTGACLEGAQLIRTDLGNATLTGSFVYGVSVWDIMVNDGTKQQNLIITPKPDKPITTDITDPNPDKPVITVDNIKVAQFIYLLLNNQEIRQVIDTITSKAVLILGRFSKERKAVLDAIREELRNYNYLPIMFDFEATTNQATIETIKTLASMARFVVADLTDARSVLMELMAIIPDFPSVAVRLLIKKSAPEYGMVDFFRKFSSVVNETFEYEEEQEVTALIKEKIIVPAEAKVRELRHPPARRTGG